MKYKFLPHTADVKFQAFGNSLEECFANAGMALVEIICKEKIKPVKRKTIRVKARDRESLLYNFLEEFLYLIEVGDFLVGEIREIKITSKKNKKNRYDKELVAEVWGDEISNYETEGDVKAITYNDMFVVKEGDRFKCQVVVDV